MPHWWLNEDDEECVYISFTHVWNEALFSKTADFYLKNRWNRLLFSDEIRIHEIILLDTFWSSKIYLQNFIFTIKNGLTLKSAT